MNYPNELLERFEKFWMPLSDCSCWAWIGSVRKGGYGQFAMPGFTSPRVATHASLMLYRNSVIPEGKLVLHRCDNPWCVNPDHLFIGDAKANSIDCICKHRNKGRLGENHVNARLTEKDVIMVRNSTESCRSIARRLNVHPTTIERVRNGKTWNFLTNNERN